MPFCIPWVFEYFSLSLSCSIKWKYWSAIVAFFLSQWASLKRTNNRGSRSNRYKNSRLWSSSWFRFSCKINEIASCPSSRVTPLTFNQRIFSPFLSLPWQNNLSTLAFAGKILLHWYSFTLTAVKCTILRAFCTACEFSWQYRMGPSSRPQKT